MAIREEIRDTIIAAFGDDFVGIQDKKIYIKAIEDNGEEAQFAISITKPKIPIAGSLAQSTEELAPTAALTQEDKNTVDELMRRLGLI